MAVGDLACNCRRSLVELLDAILKTMHRETAPRPAEGIGGEQLRPSAGVLLEDAFDHVGMLDIPQFRGSAVGEAGRLKHGSHGAVTEYRTVVEGCTQVAHRGIPSQRRQGCMAGAAVCVGSD